MDHISMFNKSSNILLSSTGGNLFVPASRFLPFCGNNIILRVEVDVNNHLVEANELNNMEEVTDITVGGVDCAGKLFSF